MKKLDINYVISLGIKQELIEKLGKTERQYLIAFVMDHATSSNLVKMVLQLISTELQGKYGSLQLASLGIATSMQLKNLSAKQIQTILENLIIHKDSATTANLVKKMLIRDQQEKLFHKTGGVKGGYADESFDEDEKWL